MATVRTRGSLKRRGRAPRLDGAAASLAASARRRAALRKIALFLGLVVLAVLAFGRSEGVSVSIQEGEVWRQEDVSAPFDFAIRKPDDVLRAERQAIRDLTPPVFRAVPDVRVRSEERRDSLRARLTRALRLAAAGAPARSVDSARAGGGLPLSARQWELLQESFGRAQGEDAARLDARIVQSAYLVALRLEESGVLDVPIDTVRTRSIVVRNDDARSEHVLATSAVRGQDQVFREAREALLAEFGSRPDTVAMGTAVVGLLLEPSLRYDPRATADAVRSAMQGLSPSEGAVRENEVIVREGDVVTAEILRKLRSLEAEESERRGDRFGLAALAGRFLLTLAVFLVFFLYLYLLRRPLYDDNRMVFLMSILFAAVIGLYAVAVRFPSVDMYVVPVTIVALLLTVIFDSRVAIFGLLTLALLGGLYRGMDFTFALGTLFGGSLGVFSVRDIRNRGQFFLSAGLVFLGYATVIAGAWLVEASSTERFLSDLLFAGISAILLLLAYPLLWVFERTFDLTTDLTLLELSDTNRPLLKELSLRAPGTFNHVLQVANLAEAGASAIGANALLARVGALYHDIGKMVKPEYFVENQRLAANPHDQLKPHMSALIIASHVKEGLELGRQYGLPKRVLDFIPMHHGTTRIEYFYRRAKEQEASGEAPTQDSEFRYPGPRPDSKETAILMLADSIEAASRTLRSPNHKRLEALIDSMIDARLSDGQLDEADLTLRDLHTIKETFLSILLGIYHVRVSYPDTEPDADSEAAPEDA